MNIKNAWWFLFYGVELTAVAAALWWFLDRYEDCIIAYLDELAERLRRRG